MSVDDRAVWLSMLNSTVWFRYGITEDEPQVLLLIISSPSPHHLLIISSLSPLFLPGYVVWGISSNKRAVVRIGITPETKEGVDWSEMMLGELSKL